MMERIIEIIVEKTAYLFPYIREITPFSQQLDVLIIFLANLFEISDF